MGGEAAYPRQSASDRKMALYGDVISYFDKGKVGIEYMLLQHLPCMCNHIYTIITIQCRLGSGNCLVYSICTFTIMCYFISQLWECGIDHCKEIASQLETHFLYEKLGQIHVGSFAVHHFHISQLTLFPTSKPSPGSTIVYSEM